MKVRSAGSDPASRKGGRNSDNATEHDNGSTDGVAPRRDGSTLRTELYPISLEPHRHVQSPDGTGERLGGCGRLPRVSVRPWPGHREHSDHGREWSTFRLGRNELSGPRR